MNRPMAELPHTIGRRVGRALDVAVGKLAIKKHMGEILQQPGHNVNKRAVMRMKDKEAGRMPASYEEEGEQQQQERKKDEKKEINKNDDGTNAQVSDLVESLLKQINQHSGGLKEFSSERPHDLSDREQARMIIKFMKQ